MLRPVAFVFSEDPNRRAQQAAPLRNHIRAQHRGPIPPGAAPLQTYILGAPAVGPATVHAVLLAAGAAYQDFPQRFLALATDFDDVLITAQFIVIFSTAIDAGSDNARVVGEQRRTAQVRYRNIVVSANNATP